MPLNLSHSPTAPSFFPKTKGWNSPSPTAPTPTMTQLVGTTIETGSSSGEVTIGDAIFDRNTGATYYNSGAIVVEHLPGAVLSSLNPEVATVAQDGTITKVSDGLCIIRATGDVTLQRQINLISISGGSVDVYVRELPGCLSEHLSEQVDSRIDNTMTMNANGLIYSTQDHDTSNYVRNPNLWCADVDMTCCSPWNSRQGKNRAGTLITPRHTINAAHYPLHNGDTIRFIEANGTVHTRTIVGSKSVTGTDIRINTLDSDLPVSITPCEVSPADVRDYCVYPQNRPAALGLDQEEKVVIMDWRLTGGHQYPTDTDRLIFSEEIIGGDSGNPAFVIYNDALILHTTWGGGGAGSGTPVYSYIPEINAAIITSDAQSEADTGYTMTEADFSAFPTY